MNSKHTRNWAKVIIATVAAIGILIAGVVAYFALRYEQRKDVDTQFKVNLDRLLQSGGESALSPAVAEQLLADLGAVIEKKSEGDAHQVKLMRQTVAERLAKRFGSTSFDLNSDDNVRLELIAFKHWREYSDLLIQDYKANVLIVRAYSLALSSLHDRDPQFVERAVLRSDDGIQSIGPKDHSDGELLKNLFYGYRNHQAVLKETVKRNGSQESKDNLLLSFCWCYSATHNQKLTQSIFRYDDPVFISEHKRCEEAGLLSLTAK